MRKIYTEEFRNNVVRRFADGENITIISKETGLSRGTIYNWISNAQEKENKKKKPLNFRIFHDLNVKCNRLEQIVEILQSSPCSTTATLSEKYEVIKELGINYGESLVCEALKVSRGSYYNHKFRNANENTQSASVTKTITPIIEEIYYNSNQTYGAVRVQAVLAERGYHVAAKRVSEIMKKNGWFSIQGGAKALHETLSKTRSNLIKQQFKVHAPNQVWVSDVTYLNFNNKTYYLCVIIDLYARKVISYSTSNSNSTHLVKKCLKNALTERTYDENLIFHSDQGGNYTSKAFRQYLYASNIKQSLSRPGMPYDNSVMESFFKTFKQEEFYRKTYKSEKDLLDSIQKYINYYNFDRLHSVNNYRTPNQAEALYYERTEKNNCTV